MHSYFDQKLSIDNTTALFVALGMKDAKAIMRLILLDIDWTKSIIVDDRKCTPLHVASINRHWKVVEIMARRIDETLQPDNLKDRVQFGAAILDAVHANKTHIVRLLLSTRFAQSLINKSNFYTWNFTGHPSDHATHTAVRHNNADILSLLLDFGYPIDQKNGADDTITKLALQLKSWQCLKAIARRTELPATYFAECHDAAFVLSMMLANIPLQSPGYHHDKIQKMREEIFNCILALPKEQRLTVLNIAKNKSTLLGSYLLCYKQSLLDSVVNSKLSTKSFEKRIDAEILALTPPKPRATTTELYDEFDLDNESGEGLELVVTRKNLEADSDDDTDESASYDDVQTEEKDSFLVSPPQFSNRPGII